MTHKPFNLNSSIRSPNNNPFISSQISLQHFHFLLRRFPSTSAATINVHRWDQNDFLWLVCWRCGSIFHLYLSASMIFTSAIDFHRHGLVVLSLLWAPRGLAEATWDGTVGVKDVKVIFVRTRARFKKALFKWVREESVEQWIETRV